MVSWAFWVTVVFLRPLESVSDYKPQKKFEDLLPSGEEEEVLVADIARDLSQAENLAEDVEEDQQ